MLFLMRFFEIRKNDFDDDVNFDSLNLNETPSPTSNLDASTSEISLPKDWKYVVLGSERH